MTVLRINSDEYAYPRRRNKTAGFRRRGGISAFYYQPVRRDTVLKRRVIAEKRRPLPAFSAEGIRWDVLVITFVLALALFFCVLGSDLEALVTGGNRIGKLNAGIASLEESNGLLRERISLASGRTVLSVRADAGEPEQIVFLSPAPVE